MRLFRLLACAFIVILISSAASPLVVVASPSMPFEGAQMSHPEPVLTARAAIAVDLSNGLQLYASEADTQLAPASTVKIVTALVARQILGPEELITIVEDDLYLGEEYSQMGLLAGDVATVESLFYGVMLSSGADASLALARVAGQRLDPDTSDPVGRFVQEMNDWAQQYRLRDSNFTNPVGIDDEQHYMSARDLVRATEQMLDDWLLFNVGATPEVLLTVDGPNARELYLFSSNQFVLTGDAIGGKTGTTEAAGQCLVNVVKRGDHTIVTVVLGSGDRFGDTDALLASISERFRFVVLGANSLLPALDDELASLGMSVPVHATVMMTAEQVETLSYDLQLTGDRSPNGKTGVIVFRTANHEVARLPVHSTG